MDEKRQKDLGGAGLFSVAAPIVMGLVMALSLGWWVFPSLLFSEKRQPVAFSHKTHLEEAGQSCTDCHFLREDGSFSGIPKAAVCENCHTGALGETQAELDYIENYVEQAKEVQWFVHQKQPDNVFFSHAAHSSQTCGSCHTDFAADSETPEALCMQCHLSTAELDKRPAYRENRLTGYSKTTMKMQQCEACHAHPSHYGEEGAEANNACYTCHK
jgi:hypothetical protein